MSDYIEVVVIVEGKTEEIFINSILKEYLALKNIYMTPIQISKPGQKGGDVRFSRAIKDISLHLKQRSDIRYIPYIAVHEFESLLFSDSRKIASVLNVNKIKVDAIIDQFRDPEKINNSPVTAPSKRLEKLNPRYKKTSTGITVARNIGIPKMRDKCKVFDNWINQLEALVGIEAE
jgi:uncharacterized protein DUF4276